ncbi:P-loop NTPase [Emticicia sp. CRIBPO]|uniref:Mrp/NBP35 family ATP-binding protein n=1 Tax=Emticicia sp. CRIBPO TaxID=2683258 RepID=UPI001411C80D|nr:Mrp/NBP35 family ATP-binding protein [Emticicia sp. CRIBPO]NBA86167.1 P-loop NTPase [Emticicia sp. CRIBPO]
MGEVRVNKEKILAALGTVEEPDLKKDLVTLNMIRDIEVGVNQVSFTVVLTTPACPLKELIKNRCIEAIHRDCGDDIEVTINMTADVTSIRTNTSLLSGVKNIIAISSGKGGVGKSTVTVNLAMALKKSGAKVGIIDADISGPSIPIMFGAEDMQPMIAVKNGKNMISPISQFGIKMISIGFLTPADSAVIWRGPMASQALRQFFGDVDWGELDYLLIDLPPGTSDIHLTLVQTVPVTGAIVVTTPQKVAVADANKGMAMFNQAQIKVPLLGVIENMAYFTPAELPDNKYYIFGQGGGQMLADKYNVPLIGQIPLVQKIREGGDEGRPIVMDSDEITNSAFKNAAEALARLIAIRNAELPKTEKVDIV